MYLILNLIGLLTVLTEGFPDFFCCNR